MKVFKAAAIAALTTLIFAFSAAPPNPARADTHRYAYADLNSTVYVCSEKTTESALFIIPQTYCVEILNEDGGWYRVKYAEDNGIYRAVYGYCRKAGLISINEPLENTYLNQAVKVTYRAEAAGSLFPPLEIELTAAYYGAYEHGISTLSYVYCGDRFGYIPQTVESYPMNELPKQTVAEAPEPDAANAMLVTAIVITSIAAAAITALYISSRKRPPTKL